MDVKETVACAAANPYKQLLMDKLNGVIPYEEFRRALAAQVAGDPKLLQEYRSRPLPTEPFGLRELRQQNTDKLRRTDESRRSSPTQLDEHRRLLSAKLRQEFYAYFESTSEIENLNTASKEFLAELLESLEGSLAGAVRQVLAGHEIR